MSADDRYAALDAHADLTWYVQPDRTDDADALPDVVEVIAS